MDAMNERDTKPVRVGSWLGSLSLSGPWSQGVNRWCLWWIREMRWRRGKVLGGSATTATYGTSVSLPDYGGPYPISTDVAKLSGCSIIIRSLSLKYPNFKKPKLHG
jgi:hypothetical protein